jgi:hypothetical protein
VKLKMKSNMAKTVTVEERKIRKYRNLVDTNTIGLVNSFICFVCDKEGRGCVVG